MRGLRNTKKTNPITVNLNLKYIHIGDGRFIAENSNGDFVDLGQNSIKRIKYTYGENFDFRGEKLLSKMNYQICGNTINYWEISSEQLNKDCEPKIMEEFSKNKLKK